jgi:hypothetical protein
MYLGTELQKAEIALINTTYNYQQDQPMELKNDSTK